MFSVAKITMAPATTAGSSSGATFASFFAMTSARERSRAWRAFAPVGLLVFDAGMRSRVLRPISTAGSEPGSISERPNDNRSRALIQTIEITRGYRHDIQ
jgi:hypothetical protein